MQNPNWWEDPPEDPPEPADDAGLAWDTPDHAPYQDRDCDYWRRLTKQEQTK